MQVSIGSFKFLLKRQNEYVETAIGLGQCDSAMLCPANACVEDEKELRPKAAVAATERVRKVLRLIDSITCPFKYSYPAATCDCRYAKAAGFGVFGLLHNALRLDC